MVNFTFRSVCFLDDYEHLRVIRNACREFMTRDQSEISPEMQMRWRESLPSTSSAYLFLDNAMPCGYGLIRNDDEDSWLSGGLLAPYRGRRLGTVLFALLVSRAPKTPALEVLSSNARAIATYQKLGFFVEKSGGGVLTMRKR